LKVRGVARHAAKFEKKVRGT